MQTDKLDTLESMEAFRKTLPPIFWGYEVRAFPKEYFKENYISKFSVGQLKTKKTKGKNLYKPISKIQV